MKKIIYILLLFSPFIGYAQIIEGSLMHDGLEREYRLYVPAIYSGQSAVPLVLNFHGYGSNALQQDLYTSFNLVADTANFILVYPQLDFGH